MNSLDTIRNQNVEAAARRELPGLLNAIGIVGRSLENSNAYVGVRPLGVLALLETLVKNLPEDGVLAADVKVLIDRVYAPARAATHSSYAPEGTYIPA